MKKEEDEKQKDLLILLLWLILFNVMLTRREIAIFAKSHCDPRNRTFRLEFFTQWGNQVLGPVCRFPPPILENIVRISGGNIISFRFLKLSVKIVGSFLKKRKTEKNIPLFQQVSTFILNGAMIFCD